MVALKDFVPPVLGRAIRPFRTTPDLFDGDGEMFKRLAATAKVYGEYGMGASSLWVLANTNAKVIAVDTSNEWVASVRASAGEEPRLTASWVDAGPIGDWGTPLGYTARQNFPQYFNAIWEQPDQPDLVLVDGRFRVACFLTSLLRSKPGTRIVFDDYTNRPHYHLIEEIVPRAETCGRQAMFTTPDRLDRDALQNLIESFSLVRD